MFLQPGVREAHSAGNGFRHVPRAFPASRVTDRPATRAGKPPASPVAHPQAATQPLIEPVEQLQLRRQTEVAHPAVEVTP